MKQCYLLRASHVQPFIKEMIDIGMPLSSMLQKCNIEEHWLSNPSQLINEPSVWKLLNIPYTQEGIVDFGFQVTQRNALTSYGEFGRSLSACRTVYEAIHKFISSMPKQTNAPTFRMQFDDKYLWFIRDGIKGVSEGCEQVEQHVIGLMIQTVRLGAGNLWTPPKVRMQAQYLSTDVGQSFLGESEITLGHAYTAIAIPKKTLLESIDPKYDIIRNVKSERIIPTELDVMINDLMKHGHASTRFELKACAQQLGVHPRWLQRNLRENNTSFREIATKYRMELAKAHLTDASISITEVALELGYSDQANFWRAFIKYTGVSPTEYRKFIKQS
ncbi:TPA: helix-turn-helix transcriptional regulator [Vibrio parahaemolyticus]|uniref:helix-turn-helix transcriptional regulator n=1 Tax=Vibrio parahaemolyticus TaxID=670 RepID=UPI00038E2762|nr:helix-turn-helix transcriptional regulator [Vibrio parahaemolyticus]EQM12731.1 bacterial regulatory helix-turn-helix s, AraC family protein [Vibrio parahaemolyticus 3259]ETJ91982.1 bacterial regulatory helix-turn-helix s, AraC family protein [Vibrio parahaemolyticus EKP-008]